MKPYIALLTLALTLTSARSEVLFDYETGELYDIFHPASNYVFSPASGVGIGGSRALAPANIDYTINFLRAVPRDFSVPQAIIEVSTFFQVKRPTSATYNISTLQLGFCQKTTPSSFISPYQTGSLYWELEPKDTTSTASGFRFVQSVGGSLYNGSTSAGRYWSNPNAIIILAEGIWYKATFRVERVSDSVIKMSAFIDDYGAGGTTFVRRVTSTGSGETIGSETHPYSILAADSTLYPAVHGRDAGGLSIVDNTVIAGTPSPNMVSPIEAHQALEIIWSTVSDKQYYLQRSHNLQDWEYIEGPIEGNGSSMQRFFSMRHDIKQFFRVTTEAP